MIIWEREEKKREEKVKFKNKEKDMFFKKMLKETFNAMAGEIVELAIIHWEALNGEKGKELPIPLPLAKEVVSSLENRSQGQIKYTIEIV